MSNIWSNAAMQGGLSSAAGGRSSQLPGQGTAAAAATSQSANASSGSSASSSSNATISANDFLTLLVTEMQNQDPTANTDPNEYINQLVQINSLEQLISINQNLTTVLGTASTSGASAGVTGAAGAVTGASSGAAIPTDTAKDGSVQAAGKTGISKASSAGTLARPSPATSRVGTVAGNLSSPPVSPAARRVGQSLGGRRPTVSAGHAIRDIPTRPLP